MSLDRPPEATASWSKKAAVKSLEKLASNVYLSYLEDACAAYIRLLCLDNKLLKEVRDRMIAVLKQQLASNLSGIMSSSVRQEMIREVKNSGRFPSPKYQHKYANPEV